ncbi:MAG: hypothetical protein RLY70_2955 [Planctomycetota bacterium]
MPIEFRCSGCGKLLRTPDESAGQKARCPGCGTIVGIPSASSVSTEGSGNAAGGEPPVGGVRSPANPFNDGAQAAPSSKAYGSAADGSGGYEAGGVDGRGPRMANPYAAPTLAPRAPATPEGQPLSHTLLTIEQLLRTTWEFLRDQFWMVVLLGLVMMALGFVTAIITTPINLAAQATQDVRVIIAGQVGGQFLSVFVQVFIQLGATMTVMRWARSGSIDIAEMFKVGPYYLRGLGITLLVQLMITAAIFVCLIPLIAFIPSKNQDWIVISGIAGGLIALPIVFWIAYSFLLAIPIMMDRNTSIREALALSRVYMAGNMLTVFVAGLIGGLIALPFVICTCGLGLLAMGPAYTLFQVLIYLLATGQPIHQPGMRPTPPYPPSGFAPPQYASGTSQPQYPQAQYPQAQYPQPQYPQPQYPQPQYPQAQYPQPQYPQPQYPQAENPQTPFPQPTATEPAPQQPTQQAPQQPPSRDDGPAGDNPPRSLS